MAREDRIKSEKRWVREDQLARLPSRVNEGLYAVDTQGVRRVCGNATGYDFALLLPDGQTVSEFVPKASASIYFDKESAAAINRAKPGEVIAMKRKSPLEVEVFAQEDGSMLERRGARMFSVPAEQVADRYYSPEEVQARGLFSRSR
jgi:hypothetical protein